MLLQIQHINCAPICEQKLKKVQSHVKNPQLDRKIPFTYQGDQPAATAAVPLAQFASEELEVDMFEEKKQASEQHATGQQDEGTREVEYSQRLARLAILRLGRTGARQPELLKPFHFTCSDIHIPCHLHENIFQDINRQLNKAGGLSNRGPPRGRTDKICCSRACTVHPSQTN